MKTKLTRRCFVQGTAASLGAGWVISGHTDSVSVFSLTDDQKRSLQAALAESDPNYDPEAEMIRSKVGAAGYHTTLKSGTVHPTNNSLSYAVALLDSGELERLTTAKEILEAVIALQDQDPNSETYGIWSWYLEEPLEKMSPPDWNWADFLGVQLLAAWVDHRDRLPAGLQEKLRESILHAAQSIERRNMGPHYTNIAIMGTYVTLVVGERLDQPDLLVYARKRLRGLHEYVIGQGSLNEYNSPTYTIVAIRELTRMLMHFQSEEDRNLVRDIHDLAWKHAATRFHPPTRQWAGPHSRSYRTDLRDSPAYLAFLEAATGRRRYFSTADPLPLGLGHYRLDLACPPRFLPYFVELNESREVVEVFNGGDPARVGKTKAVIGTTYLHPKFTLGTVNRGMFWNQRRSILAYWGTPEKPTYLHVRFLHDDYDYSSASVFTAQSEGCALSTVVFATDYGDTHPNLDLLKNETIRARDLRMRFEFGGEVESAHLPESLDPQRGILVEDRDILLGIRLLGFSFGESQIRWETGGDEKKKWIDAVVYSGDEREFDFSKMEEAFLAFALRIGPTGEDDVSFEGLDLSKDTAWIETEWKRNGLALRVKTPKRPASIHYIRDHFETSSE